MALPLRTRQKRRRIVTKRTLGIFAVVGSALGAWWLTRQRRDAGSRAQGTATEDRGTVIFDNTPTASDVDAII
jgi:hypothetical protein